MLRAFATTNVLDVNTPVNFVSSSWSLSRDHVIALDVMSTVTAFPVMAVFPNPTFEDTKFNRPPLICQVHEIIFVGCIRHTAPHEHFHDGVILGEFAAVSCAFQGRAVYF
jgi:hypothetical protein